VMGHPPSVHARKKQCTENASLQKSSAIRQRRSRPLFHMVMPVDARSIWMTFLDVR
jgi:hypothetical protein